MLKSLYSGVSGMKGFQTQLDTIGNNIANVNTVGFKKSRVEFQDIVNQNLSGATAPNGQTGGINPQQVGLGSKIAAIDTIHTPGSPMTTNVGTDLAIDGDGYFVVNNGTQDYLTKAGNFNRDANGTLVNSNGYKVVGVTGTATNPQEVNISINQDDKTGQKFTSFSIDADGHINVVSEDGTSGELAYDSQNQQYYLNDGTNDGTNNPDDIISIGTAVVNNPEGLTKAGDTLFETSPNSGAATAERSENNNAGQIESGVLEMSNVDLTEEFTEMIVAQRGFQANARTITTSDTILQELIDLKRN
ncbi:flagellar hook-basal body complex protein [Pullulanibacillus sp. KACC 23026]|uniref:flagellar hook-basal body complex protein n=1 Tax=Pullulanibacillus sp. KACC 23026 TaxID=3028315 RepID=UPI0023AE7496|nr:flagellar hook-basal body complex protein [Pullulanibacillus sp. KACC 23026]WEG11265.1 flagellar hook-basal body complex protein [Pullulanibacillus sp. KACC 23026]